MNSETPDSTGTPASAFTFVTRRPVAITMFMVAIAVFGLVSLAKLPMDLLPEISYPTLTVRTSWAGAAPEDVGPVEVEAAPEDVEPVEVDAAPVDPHQHQPVGSAVLLDDLRGHPPDDPANVRLLHDRLGTG